MYILHSISTGGSARDVTSVNDGSFLSMNRFEIPELNISYMLMSCLGKRTKDVTFSTSEVNSDIDFHYHDLSYACS